MLQEILDRVQLSKQIFSKLDAANLNRAKDVKRINEIATTVFLTISLLKIKTI